VPVIQSQAADSTEMAGTRARYQSEGFTVVEDTGLRVRLVKGDVVVEVSLAAAAATRAPGPSRPPRRLAIIVIALVVLGAVGYGALSVTGYAPGECTAGVTGTAFNVEVSGIGAENACSKAEKSGLGLIHRVDPSGDVVCQYNQHFTTVTVRDQGRLKIAGTLYCNQLAKDFGAVPQPLSSP
jgi:hypothetical protein